MNWRLVAAWNVLKTCLLVVGGCVAIGAIGWPIGGYRLVSLLVFFGLLVAAAAYWYGDRVVLGMVGARELPVGEAPALHASVAALAGLAGVPKPRLYVLSGRPSAGAGGRPRAARRRDRGQPRLARLPHRPPSSRASSRTSWLTSATGTCSCRRPPSSWRPR